MKATLLAIASARSKTIRRAQNVAKTSPAATYPIASVSMVCCMVAASSGPATAAERPAGKRACSDPEADHRAGLPIELDGTSEAALRSLFKDPKNSRPRTYSAWTDEE